MKPCRRERLIESGLGKIRVRPIAISGYWIGEDGSLWTNRPKRHQPRPSTLRRVKQVTRNTPGRGFGYEQVCLRRRGSRKVYTYYVHALVLTAFVGPRPTPEHEGCHRNNTRTDNRLFNLRWDTPAGNALDKKRRGLDVDPLAELRADLATIAAGYDPNPIPF